MDDGAQERQNWIEKTIYSLLSSKQDGEPTGTPEEMIDEAGQRAFKIGTALGLIPGPLGMAVILPEIAALTRLQINLIHRIAGHHGNRRRSAERSFSLFSEMPWAWPPARALLGRRARRS